MAGLLDIFGSGGTSSLGLLGMSPEGIGQARNDAQAQALYALAGSLLQGGQSTGASIARGLQQGQQAYKQAMQGQLQDQLQGFQLQDVLRKRKQEEEALRRQQMIDAAVARAYVPGQAAVEAPTPTGPISGAAFGEVSIPAVTPKLDLQSITPALMASREGRAALAELSKTQEAMMPKYQAVGDVLYRLGAEGATPVAGATKGPTSMQEFLAAQSNPAYAAFLREKESLKAPKIAVDLKDPTAVAKAQADVLKDWRGVVKDTGAMEVADRFKAAQQAVSAGNSGNKTADGALIYAIGKIYDPSGAVQEGDKQTILGNRSIPDSIKAYAQKAFSGQSLLPDERNGLLSVARSIVETKAKNLEAQKAPYASISSQLGGNGSLLLNPLADVLTQQPTDLATQAAQILKQRRGGK
jgi:hypothetical protein